MKTGTFKNKTLFLLVGTMIFSSFGLIRTASASPQVKKLIELGWDHVYMKDITNPDFVKKMQSKPFSGFPLRLGNTRAQYSRAFDTDRWQKDGIPFDKLKKIDWGHYTDNFILLYGTNYAKMDWFSDNDWQTIQTNMRLVSRAMDTSENIVGVLFDPEPYGRNPWAYKKKWYPDKSFKEVAAKVRQRGAQFIEALQSQKPDMKLLSLHMWRLFRAAARTDSPDMRRKALAHNQYGLYLPFVKGMLDAAKPGVVFIDGNESTYYIQRLKQYKKAYQLCREIARALLGPNNQAKLNTQQSIAVAMYVDRTFGSRKGRKTIGNYLTPKQRAKLFSYQIQEALNTADEYVWVYSERMNWWKNKTPMGLEKAIRTGIKRYRSGKPLDRAALDKLLEQVKRARSKQARAKRIHATVSFLNSTAAPKIDGILKDPAWRRATWLKPFVPQKSSKGKESNVVATNAAVTYDHHALYVAVRCEEPHVNKIKSIGDMRDAPSIWSGDDIELFISTGQEASPFWHLIVNPQGTKWDAFVVGMSMNVNKNGKWSVATDVGSNQWTAEFSIPWKMLGGNPANGSIRRINICRARYSPRQLSSWSPVASGFVEPARFGVWEFNNN